ncbi:MAG: N-acetylmuramoyl-L-alanine amidase [Oscillospiraceae bacterium]|nr:N-acetylmuramoyl-L-alanine amidase [Oscillospiraceae bacterium]
MAKRRIRWGRMAMLFVPVFVIILLICTQCGGGSDTGEESSEAGNSGSSSVSDTSGAPVDAPDPFVVVLDAGHGGFDGGSTAVGVTRLEKDDNLTLALATQQALLKYPGVNVIMTRTTDDFISLQDRCDVANNAGADLFVSLHRNCATEGNGVEIWINREDDVVDKALAEYILELLDEVGISRNRGIKFGFRGVSGENSDNQGDSYYVNANTDMPSCLVELGFLTNDEDNANFDKHLDDYADAIARGIVELGMDENLYNRTALQ